MEMIRAFADAHPELERIRGTGWFVGNWGNAALPDKRLLDEAVGGRPVYLQCAGAHSMWLVRRPPGGEDRSRSATLRQELSAS